MWAQISLRSALAVALGMCNKRTLPVSFRVAKSSSTMPSMMHLCPAVTRPANPPRDLFFLVK
eukprot:4816612-Alexandrium_andersonii.AAC.1